MTVPPGATFTHPTPRGHTVFAYVIGGKGVFCRQKDPYSYEAEGASYFDMERGPLLGDGHLVLFGDGDAVTISAEQEPVRFLLISGKPIGEPIAWYGPIVMNTQEELRVAFDELDNGTFLKTGAHRPVSRRESGPGSPPAAGSTRAAGTAALATSASGEAVSVAITRSARFAGELGAPPNVRCRGTSKTEAAWPFAEAFSSQQSPSPS